MWRIIDTMQEFIDRTTGVRSIMCEIAADTAADLPANTADRVFILGTFATAIDTGNIYKINSVGAWILQPSQNAFSNVYTTDEIDTMINAIYQTMMYYHTAQESTDGSITFYTIGGNVGSLVIYGNGVQGETPEFVGVKTVNLFDKSEQAGQIYVTESVQRYGVEIPVSAGTYTTSGGTSTVFAKTKIGDTYGDAISLNAARIFTLESDGYILVYAAIQSVYDVAKDSIMLNSGSTALPYEPFGYKIPISCAGQTSTVYIGDPIRKALDGSDAIDVMYSTGTITRKVDVDGNALATPTTETIDFPTISTVSGENTLTVDTDLPPSKIIISGE